MGDMHVPIARRSSLWIRSAVDCTLIPCSMVQVMGMVLIAHWIEPKAKSNLPALLIG